MSPRRILPACLALVVLGACGLAVDGQEAATSEGGAEDGASSDVTPADAPDSAAGGDVADALAADVPSKDSAPSADSAPSDACTSTPENCTNGVDDNCNGLVDCADPECTSQGYQCVTPAPPGWDVSPFDTTARPGCPAGLNGTDVDVDPSSPIPPAQCSCSCSPTVAPSCEQGMIAVSAGPDSSCSAGMASYPASGGACNAATITVATNAMVTQPPASGGTCAAGVVTTKPPTGARQGQLCRGEATFGGGCTGGQQCAHVPTGFQACIHHGGANMACPAGPYSAPNAVGTMQDNRACGACTCAAPTATCTAGSWTFYTGAGCTGTSITLTADGRCDPTGSAGSAFQSNRFSSSATDVACAAPAMQPMPTGAAQLTGQDTVCCE